MKPRALTTPRVEERLPLRLVLYGAPRTKKTSNRLVRAGKFHKVLPSEAWCDWCAEIVPNLKRTLTQNAMRPIDYPVNCRALFYRDALRGDAVGFYQGLADLLEKAGVVENDRWVLSWDGSRLLKDAANPRVELELTPIGD